MLKNLHNSEGEIDVRQLVPVERHRRLLKLFKNLPKGADFVFINDHDPIPLYYEFQSVHGDVVGWEYLSRGGVNWKVRVTRTQNSESEHPEGIETLIDLRQIEENRQKHVVFHRFGMLENGNIMELRSKDQPLEILQIFETKFPGLFTWRYRTETPGEYVIHIQKTATTDGNQSAGASPVIQKMDLRPYPPAERHDRFYQAFSEIQKGEAFEFLNDHDPIPLYFQMKATETDKFDWQYLEKGPTVWRIRVSK